MENNKNVGYVSYIIGVVFNINLFFYLMVNFSLVSCVLLMGLFNCWLNSEIKIYVLIFEL